MLEMYEFNNIQSKEGNYGVEWECYKKKRKSCPHTSGLQLSRQLIHLGQWSALTKETLCCDILNTLEHSHMSNHAWSKMCMSEEKTILETYWISSKPYVVTPVFTEECIRCKCECMANVETTDSYKKWLLHCQGWSCCKRQLETHERELNWTYLFPEGHLKGSWDNKLTQLEWVQQLKRAAWGEQTSGDVQSKKLV